MATSEATFAIRGIAEGFYGPPFTFPQRIDLLRWAGRHGFNFYLYGPKNDRQARSRWWEAYPEKVMAGFADAVSTAERAGIRFCYAISPGVSIAYSGDADFARLQAKLKAFFDLGVRAFALMLDDITPDFQHAADRGRFASLAEAHAHLTNRTASWLASLDPSCTLALCPVDYSGRRPFSGYLSAVGRELAPGIDIFWTGPETCSAALTAADARDFAAGVGRPPLIWDNYPVNDLGMSGELHLGPIRGREPGLAAVTRGIVANAMVQPEATKIPLHTYACYLADPHAYDAERAWAAALAEAAGEERLNDLQLLAENCLGSCLGVAPAPRLDRLVSAALAALESGVDPTHSWAVRELDVYIAELDEARYRLTNWLDNLALRNDLLPWLELLDLWCWMAKRGLAVLYAIERGEPCAVPLGMMREWLAAIHRHPKRLAGSSLLALAAAVEARVQACGACPPAPDVAIE